MCTYVNFAWHIIIISQNNLRIKLWWHNCPNKVINLHYLDFYFWLLSDDKIKWSDKSFFFLQLFYLFFFLKNQCLKSHKKNVKFMKISKSSWVVMFPGSLYVSRYVAHMLSGGLFALNWGLIGGRRGTRLENYAQWTQSFWVI